MRKFLIFSVLGLSFIACDFVTESVALKPDIEVTYVDPVAASVDSGSFALIEKIYFVARNSVDAHIEKMVWEYYTVDGTPALFLGPFDIPIYVKVKGIVDPSFVDTSKLYNVPLPIDTVRTYLISQGLYEAKAQIYFIATDDYEQSRADTAIFWFGLYRNP